jgi:hypothetical protein
VSRSRNAPPQPALVSCVGFPKEPRVTPAPSNAAFGGAGASALIMTPCPSRTAHLARSRRRHPSYHRNANRMSLLMEKGYATVICRERIVLKQSTISFGVAATLFATIAFAQPPQPPSNSPRSPAPGAAPSPPPQSNGPTATGPAPQPSLGAPLSERPPPPSKAAHFRIEQGDNAIDVKCADEEPMRACSDIAMQFLDRLGITQARTTGSAPGQR